MYIIVIIIVALSILHFIFGLASFIIGIICTLAALVWKAETVSPIWSGIFFIISGLSGLLCCKKKSEYSIFCFVAINAVSIIVSIINMQLLRLGLVNYTTIGQSFQKEKKDNHIIAALIVGGCEGLFCILSTLASLKLGYDAKTNRFKSKRKHGTFFVQIIGEKEIVVVRSKTKNDTHRQMKRQAKQNFEEQKKSLRNASKASSSRFSFKNSFSVKTTDSRNDNEAGV